MLARKSPEKKKMQAQHHISAESFSLAQGIAGRSEDVGARLLFRLTVPCRSEGTRGAAEFRYFLRSSLRARLCLLFLRRTKRARAISGKLLRIIRSSLRNTFRARARPSSLRHEAGKERDNRIETLKCKRTGAAYKNRG